MTRGPTTPARQSGAERQPSAYQRFAHLCRLGHGKSLVATKNGLGFGLVPQLLQEAIFAGSSSVRRPRRPTTQEAPIASWGIIGSIPRLAPGASKERQHAKPKQCATTNNTGATPKLPVKPARPGGRKPPINTSGRMKTLAFQPSASRKVRHDARAFRKARCLSFP